MRRRFLRGFTLPELLVTTGISAVVFVIVCTATVQVARIHTRTTARFNPQTAEMLALRRMQYDLRDPMSVNWSSLNTTRVEVIRPLKDNADMNKVTFSDSGEGSLTLTPGKSIRFFLGRITGTKSQWTAVPSATGDTIFKVEAQPNAALPPVGATLPSSSVEIIVGPRWDDARGRWVEGVVANPPDPTQPGSTTPEPIFAYDDIKQILRVAVTISFADKTRGGWPLVYQTLRTQFYFRNVVR